MAGEGPEEERQLEETRKFREDVVEEIKKFKKVNLRIVVISSIFALGTVISFFRLASEAFAGAKIFTIFGLCFGLLAAFFFGAGLLMSKKTAEEITKTYSGGNLTALAVLMMNSEDAKFGLGFLFQLIGVILT